LTSSEKQIAHSNLVSSLLEVVQLHSSVSVIKSQAHSSSNDNIPLGNTKADRPAKLADSSSVSPSFTWQQFPLPLTLSLLMTLQATADASEKDASGVWLDEWSRPAMPRCTLQFLAKLSHDQDHMSKRGMVDRVNT
jgi:hypothetical protein